MSRFISDKLKNLFKSAPVVAATASATSAQEVMKPSAILATATTAQKLMAMSPLKPHLPLIRFRKDAALATTASHQTQRPQAGTGTGSAAPRPAAAAAGSGGVKQGSTIVLPIIEDWQLPQRYRRRPIDQDEMDYINRGGPA